MRNQGVTQGAGGSAGIVTAVKTLAKGDRVTGIPGVAGADCDKGGAGGAGAGPGGSGGLGFADGPDTVAYGGAGGGGSSGIYVNGTTPNHMVVVAAGGGGAGGKVAVDGSELIGGDGGISYTTGAIGDGGLSEGQGAIAGVGGSPGSPVDPTSYGLAGLNGSAFGNAVQATGGGGGGGGGSAGKDAVAGTGGVVPEGAAGMASGGGGAGGANGAFDVVSSGEGSWSGDFEGVVMLAFIDIAGGSVANSTDKGAYQGTNMTIANAASYKDCGWMLEGKEGINYPKGLTITGTTDCARGASFGGSASQAKPGTYTFNVAVTGKLNEQYVSGLALRSTRTITMKVQGPASSIKRPAKPRQIKVKGGPTAKKYTTKWKSPRVTKTRPVSKYVVTYTLRGHRKPVVKVNVRKSRTYTSISRAKLLRKTLRTGVKSGVL